MLFLRFISPEWFSFSSHQMIAPSQRQAGDPRYVVVNSPKVLLQSKGEQRKWVILLNHLPTHRVQTFGLDDILQWPKRTSSLLFAFKYKDINHKHFKHQPPTNVQPLCVVIIPGQSPQCRFSSSLTHTQLLLFLVEIYHEKKIRFYLLFFFKFKLINISDQLNKPFF